jgi:hypothetical protein
VLVGCRRNEKSAQKRASPRNRPQICYLLHAMTTPSGPFQIHTEEHGPHWIAWLTRTGETKPERSIVLVAATRAEAEERARRWAEQTRY